METGLCAYIVHFVFSVSYMQVYVWGSQTVLQLYHVLIVYKEPNLLEKPVLVSDTVVFVLYAPPFASLCLPLS